MKRILLTAGLALAVLCVPVTWPHLSAAGSVVQTVAGIDDATPATWAVNGVSADRCLALWTVHEGADSATPTDDEDNVWSTPVTQTGSSRIVIQSIKCDTVAADYAVSLDVALRTFVVKFVVELAGLQTSNCIDDESATGNENASDTSPLTGATVTCSGACMILGLGVTTTTGDLTTEDTLISEQTSSSTIMGNLAWKRRASAGTDNLSWTMAAGAPTLSLSVALKEIAAGGATRKKCPIIGGYYGCEPLVGWFRPAPVPRPLRAWAIYPNGRVERMRL